MLLRDATGKQGEFAVHYYFCAKPVVIQICPHLLHIFGFGCCGDNREGTTRLLGPNLAAINQMIKDSEDDRPIRVSIDGVDHDNDIHVDLYFTNDVCALRHGEHISNSGWCGCTRDEALRQIPTKPNTVAEMMQLVSSAGHCREFSCLEREILSHTPPEGEDLPRPCSIAPGCKFGHDRSTVAQEYKDLLKIEEKLHFASKRHLKKGASEVHAMAERCSTRGKGLFLT